MKDIHYEGKPCVNGHNNEAGNSVRYKSNGECVECLKQRQRTEHNKAYQKAYHARLRKENPERAKAYRDTQDERGHGYVYAANRATFVPVLAEPYERKKYD